MQASTAAVRADPDVRRARRAVAATFFVHGVLFASWVAHIPHVKAHLGIDNGLLGAALLGAPVGSVAAIALAGYLVTRVGSKRLVQWALPGYCLAGALVGVADSVLWLFLALLVWGAFQGTLDIAMNTQAIAVEARRGRPLMNGMHAYWGLGAFAGAGIGTLGVALGVPLSAQILVLGVPLAVGALLITGSMLADGHDPDVPRQRSGRRTVSRAMLVLGAIAFASMLCEGASADWSSVYLHDSLGASAALGGIGYTAFTLAMVVVRVLGDPLLRRYPAQRLLPVLTGVATVAFGAGLLVATPGASIAAFAVLGFGLGTVVPTAFSAAGRLPDIHPGVGVAGVSGLGWAGFVCGPPLIGQLAQLTSLPAALCVVPVLTAFIAVASARVGALRMPTPVPAAEEIPTAG